MCNIAGYAGNKPAAPILVEMLRRQACYNGDVCSGVATIHNGKLHYRKIVGNIETYIRETDVLDLPGTIGIAHTRPWGSKNQEPFHPFLSDDATMALVTNGTTPATQYCPLWDEAVDLLDRMGYSFQMEQENPEHRSPKLSRNGCYIRPPEARLKLMDYYMNQGKTPTKALTLACAHMYSDNVTVTINERYPDQIFVVRTSRPMVASMKNGETLIATTRFAFPEEMVEGSFDLPLFYGCSVTSNGVTISKDRMKMEPVSNNTAYTYHEGYKRVEAMLTSDKAPMFYDELDEALNDMRDLWPGNHTIVPNASLLYDILQQFDNEGRLKRELRTQEIPDGVRRRYYMWLEDTP